MTRVWPTGCVCQAERAPGSKVTCPPDTRDGAVAGNMGSTRTVPVKYSGRPFADGCEPARVILKVCTVAGGRLRLDDARRRGSEQGQRREGRGKTFHISSFRSVAGELARRPGLSWRSKLVLSS